MLCALLFGTATAVLLPLCPAGQPFVRMGCVHVLIRESVRLAGRVWFLRRYEAVVI